MSQGNYPRLLSGWQTVPLKHAVSINPEVLPDYTPPDTLLSYVDIAALENGVADLNPTEVTFEAAPSRARRVLRDGDTILSTVRTYLKAVASFPKVDANLIASTGFAVLRPNGMLHSRFAYWAALAEPFIENVVAHSDGVSYPSINPTLLGTLPIVVPPATDQKRIAIFLDDKTARIDALIADKELLVEKLREYWRSVSAEIVVRGIRKSSSVTETGIPWLGKTPSHWELRPMKTLFRLVTEQSEDDHGLELLSLYTDIGVRPRKDLEQKGNRASNTDGYWLVQKDDLVVNKLLAWMGAIAASNYSGVTSPAYDILRPTADINTWYYDALFRSGIYLTEFKSKSRGIMDMRLRLYFEELGTVKVPFPPREEQDEIVKALHAKKAHIDELIDHCVAHIDRLHEYRSSLISAAVTGQIDVSKYKEMETA
jgi:type I restriction enzyme S subunit